VRKQKKSMNKSVVFDSSALLALLQQEKGSDVIQSLLNDAIMSAVNVAETLTALKRIHISPKETLTSIPDMIKIIVPFDLEQAQHVAELYLHGKNKGLSLGDRACIALGIKLKAPIYTADKIWEQLSIDNADIRLIR
jgi:PIN domain nuclease of toxin-antitoxin system